LRLAGRWQIARETHVSAELGSVRIDLRCTPGRAPRPAGVRGLGRRRPSRCGCLRWRAAARRWP
jgi:hypothetical protein